MQLSSYLSKIVLAAWVAVTLVSSAFAEDKPTKPADAAKPAVTIEAVKPAAPADKPTAKAVPADAVTPLKPAGEAAAKPTGPQPKMVIEESVKDFGTVPQGQEIKHSFKVKNTGKADLTVTATPSCGCTIANFDKIIKPGESGSVSAVVDTKSFNGPISKTITVATNDPDTQQSILYIKAIVKPFVEVLPNPYARFSILKGEAAAVQSVIVTSDERPDFKVDKVEPGQPWIKATFREATKEEMIAGRTGKQYKVDVNIDEKTAPIGPLNDKVTVHTNSAKSPTTEIKVNGVIRPLITVAPATVNLNNINAAEQTVRTVSVINNGTSTDFKVTKVESNVPGVTANFTEDEAGKRYKVDLKVTDKVKKGDLAGDVKIYTTSKDNQVITVPVHGTVQ